MEGRRHGRGWGEVGDAGGCGARARWHVPTSRGYRRGGGWEELGVPSRGAAAGAVSRVVIGMCHLPHR